MIQEAVVVMTILGCGDQAQSCDFVNSPQKTWKSEEECSAAIPSALQREKNASYPLMTATCEIKSSPQVIANVDIVENENKGLAMEYKIAEEETMFGKLRAKADAVDLDILGKVKTGLVSLADTTKTIAESIKSTLSAR